MKNGLIITVAVAALSGCASTTPPTPRVKLAETNVSVAPVSATPSSAKLAAGQQALPEKQAMAKVGQMRPTQRSTDGVGAAQAAYIAGKQALGEGKLDLALSLFGDARKQDPKLVDAHVGLGVVHSLSSRNEQAIVSFGEAVALDPMNANWHSNLGMAHARHGQFMQAQSSLAKAWSLDPS